MKYVSVLIFTVAFAYVLVETNAQQKCRNNDECRSFCGGNIMEAVCDVPSGACHCHDHGEITCNNDQMCKVGCPTPNPNACCHNDHHCHCDEPCTSG